MVMIMINDDYINVLVQSSRDRIFEFILSCRSPYLYLYIHSYIRMKQTRAACLLRETMKIAFHHHHAHVEMYLSPANRSAPSTYPDEVTACASMR